MISPFYVYLIEETGHPNDGTKTHFVGTNLIKAEKALEKYITTTDPLTALGDLVLYRYANNTSRCKIVTSYKATNRWIKQ